ncbi:MAG TPA: anhydro-N-acetylmuramic acid kinase [Phycisphaerae bacterium]|nr:anhydro-N-acetylmuramic acid kinase [Phycisphaerae bacterium]HRW51724.1 anhydro-N-acetylmuramic acid kinase [Phycisphaerae bacterium]
MKHETRLVLGLNSGTSVDGVDAVACRVRGRGAAMRVEYMGHVSRAYPAALRQRLMSVMAPAATTTEELCRLNTAVGEAFAATAALAIRRLDLKRVDLIGSHGQTICHLPPSRGRQGNRGAETGTMQIGDAAIIAERIGVSVVSGFRQADMAAGGQGAPLVPWTDYTLFRDARRTRVIQNIGGIANMTWLPAGGAADDVIAFDCGPGNMLIDALVTHFTKGRESFDRSGRRAARGRVRDDVLRAMSAHPFLKRKWPRSCGREEFGVAFAQGLLKRFAPKRIPANDWIATATRFTAVCIATAYADVMKASARRGVGDRLAEVILCGGGHRNATLVRMLGEQLAAMELAAGARITSTDDYGIPAQAKEGLSFAMLAVARTDGAPANLPQVTGARQGVLLGNVCASGDR